jgi:hypothetical protein
MNEKFSAGGDGEHWQVFGKTPKGGNQRLYRSRASCPRVRAYAVDNQMARLRCVLRDDQVRVDGMPKSTLDLDHYEDQLLGALEAADADVCLIASVTGDGNRDLFFAARDLEDLRAAIQGMNTNVDTFKLQLAPIAEKEQFLDSLSLSSEQVQAAAAAGRVHEMSQLESGGFLRRLFRR